MKIKIKEMIGNDDGASIFEPIMYALVSGGCGLLSMVIGDSVGVIIDVISSF